MRHDPKDPLWLTQEILKTALAYDPATGVFVHRATRKGVRGGRLAGCLNAQGYVQIRLRATVMAHRLAWLYMTGEWPSRYVDHIDGNRSNNAWANLRLASLTQNAANMRLGKTNTSGFKGVSFHKHNKRWRASISVANRARTLGYFSTPGEAHAAYVAAAKRLHGEFARAA